jgi:cytochrome c peroxidase
MHDGRFNTLEEVIDHYDHGVRRSATLDPNLAKHPAEGLQLSADEKSALVAFLKTLTGERAARPPRPGGPPPPPPPPLAGRPPFR